MQDVLAQQQGQYQNPLTANTPPAPPMMGGQPPNPMGGGMPNPQQQAMMMLKLEALKLKKINSGDYRNGIHKKVWMLLDPDTQNEIEKAPLEVKYQVWKNMQEDKTWGKLVKNGQQDKMLSKTETYLEIAKLLRRREDLKGLESINAGNPPPVGTMGNPGGTVPNQPTAVGGLTGMV